MAEYLAPAVYVEEKSFRSKSIEGVSTSTAAFVGCARRGPTSGTPELLTSIVDYERIYGGASPLTLSSTEHPNYLALAVRAYFDNGGRRLYVKRVASTPVQASLALTNVTVRARSGGSAGNGTVEFFENARPVSGASLVAALPVGTVIEYGSGPTVVAYRTAAGGWKDAGTDADVTPAADVDVLTISFIGTDGDGFVQEETDMGFLATHSRFFGDVLAMTPASRSAQLANLFGVELSTPTVADIRASITATLGGSPVTGGGDGNHPGATPFGDALAELEALDDISTVAAPGHTEYTDATGIRAALITHVSKRGLYRVAILDSKKGDTVSQIRTTRAGIDSKYAAMYYPWVEVSNPDPNPTAATPREVLVPPSGAVAGIFARSDNEHGVWKSPANEVVLGALRFERPVSFGESEVLNPRGVNCLRTFPGRGHRVFGARTISSDPEWKYLSVRRYFNYLEASIERGTQWAVFESNGPDLWSNVTETIDSFLYNEWRNGALLGATAREAYFVRCDRTTMTQADLDNGRMVCLIGVAVVKPAEFVIFRIGQKTASARS